MRNLLDDELFDKLGDRLRKLEQQPDDDVWEKVAGAVPHEEPTWVRWADRSAIIVTLLLLSFLYGNNSNNNTGNNTAYGLAPDSTQATSHVATGQSYAIDPSAELTPSGSERPETHASPKEPGSRTAATRPAGEQAGTLSQRQHHFDHQITGNLQIVPLKNSLPTPTFPSSPMSNIAFKAVNDPGLDVPSIQEAIVLSSPSGLASDAAGTVTQPGATNVPVADTRTDSAAEAAATEIITPAVRKAGTLNVYAIATPSLSFQHVTPVRTDAITIKRLNSPSVLSGKRHSFFFEAGVQGRITNRISYLAGLSYFQQGITISLDQISADGDFIGHAEGDRHALIPGIVTRTIDYSMRNVGASMGVLYAISVRTLTHSFGGTIQYEIGLKRNSQGEVYDNAVAKYLSYRLLYRAEYALDDRTRLFVQPALIRSLTGDDGLDGSMDVRQSRAGVGFGMLYRF